MKLNWAERWVVNNPVRVFQQRIQVRWMKRMFPLAPDALALEVGCGRGAGARLILDVFKTRRLLVSDLDVRMLEKADQYLSAGEKDRMDLHAGNVTSIPVKSDSLDAVFGFGVRHHAHDWRRAVNEIARVLKTGGAYYLEEIYPALYQNPITKRILLHPEKDRFHSEDLRGSLDQAGLDLIDAIEFRYLGILGVAVKHR